MANATDFLTSVLTNIEALGYKHAREVFNFETVPSTRLDMAYRFELTTANIQDLSGNCVDKTKQLDLFFAYKMKATKDRVKDELIEIIDKQEEIENTLLRSIIELGSNVPTTLMSLFVENYLVIQIQMTYIYRAQL